MSAIYPTRQDIDPAHAAASALPDVLGGLRAIGLPRLPELLREVLAQADDALFEFAERSGSSVEQQQFFDAMREVRRERARIEQRFGAHVERHFGQRVASQTAASALACTLSLIDTESLEEQLACEQLSTAVEKRQRELLHQIGNRLRLAAGAADSAVAALPDWARQIAEAFRAAIGPLDLTIRARLVLYKLFERQLIPAFATLLQLFDRRLQQSGLAVGRPVLQLPQAPRRPAAPRRLPAADALAEHREPPAPPVLDPAANAQRFDSYGVDGQAPAGAGRRAVAVDEELYCMLRDALAAAAQQQRDPASAAGDASGAAAGTLPRHAALDALSVLQTAPSPAILAALDDPQAALAEILTRELLAQARGLGLAGERARLQPQDAQALALVGMLFDVLLTQRSYRREVRRQFLRLSVPYAKAALLDPRMFALKSHPARRLLDTLTEASDGNQGESGAERELLARVDGVVERLLAEFNEDVAIFAELDDEIRRCLDQHQRRIELAEKRAAEAQRGRERLDQARRRALAELRAVQGAAPWVGGSLGEFLREHWTHHLTMVELREGSASERYHSARALGVAINRQLRGEPGHPLELDTFAPLLAEVLASSGQHGSMASATVERLLAELRRPEPSPRVEPVRSEPIVFHPPAADPRNDHPAPPPNDPAIDSEAADLASPTIDHLAQIALLEIGDWVEFVGDDGIAIPAKLSWISPISSRLLFVNRRGMRHCVATREELAAQLADGRLLLRSDDSAFARAMQQVLGRLQRSAAMPAQG